MEVYDAFGALEAARGEFARRLAAVRPSDWERPTPCDEWEVRSLVNHVVGGNLRYTMLLHHAGADEIAATRTTDHLGPDALAAYERTVEETMVAFGEPGALERTVEHPSGVRSGGELLVLRVVELAVHAWDLARAVEADEVLEPKLVEFLCSIDPVLERSRREGFYGPVPDAEEGQAGGRQAELLRRTGRRP